MSFILQTLITPAGAFSITAAGCHSPNAHYARCVFHSFLSEVLYPTTLFFSIGFSFCFHSHTVTIVCATNSQASLECCASPVKIIMSWNVFGLPFYIIIKIFKQSKENKGNAKRGLFPRLTIWPGDLDLWPWKWIGFLILLRTTYVPSLLKIHWKMLIL